MKKLMELMLGVTGDMEEGKQPNPNDSAEKIMKDLLEDEDKGSAPDKVYMGMSSEGSPDAKFYLAFKRTDAGSVEDIEIVDETGDKKWSAKDEGLDLNNIKAVIIAGQRKLKIGMLDMSLVDKYDLFGLAEPEETEEEKDAEEDKPNDEGENQEEEIPAEEAEQYDKAEMDNDEEVDGMEESVLAIQEKKWMKAAFNKNKGALHKALGVPEGKNIPLNKMKAALKSKNAKLRKRAVAAVNANPKRYASLKKKD